MNKVNKLIGGIALALGLAVLPGAAKAEEVSLRLEPGVAVPVTDPQASRFGVGGAFAIKPELTLTPWLGVGPSAQFLSLPSKVDGVNTGTAWSFGAFGRVKRPHDNSGKGLSAVSPWVDADLQYVYTDPLSRFGWSVGAGAAWPTSVSRALWVGPFVRYQGVFQAEKPGFDTSDAKVLVLGVSFEFGVPAAKKSVVKECPACPACPNPPPVVEKPCPAPPPVVYEDVEMELKQVIQFAWDSPKIDGNADALLKEVVKRLAAAKKFGMIKIEGHASSDGQVEHNNVLAKKRAQAVADWLIAHGVPKDKITVTGFGSSVPVAENKTEVGKVLNRRAEFVVKFTVVKEGK